MVVASLGLLGHICISNLNKLDLDRIFFNLSRVHRFANICINTYNLLSESGTDVTWLPNYYVAKAGLILLTLLCPLLEYSIGQCELFCSGTDVILRVFS